MVTKRKMIRPESSAKLRAIFACKAAGALVLLYLIGRASSFLPPMALVLIWAVMSVATAVSFAYPYIVKRINTQGMFKEQGKAARFINGRVLLLVGCFILSMLLMLGLLIEIQKWEWAEWTIAVLSIPLYLVVSIFIKKKVSEEYKDEFQTRGTMLWSWGVTGAVLLLIYIVVFAFILTGQPVGIGESFSTVKQLFSDSSSALLILLGRVEYTLDGMTSYGLLQVQQFSFVLGLVFRIAMYASAAFGLAHVLSFCLLRMSDLKLVFLPLGETKYSACCFQLLCKSIASLAVTSLCLVLLFMWADAKAEKVYQDNGFAQFNSGVQELLNLTAYEFDGKYYDEVTIVEMVDDVSQSNLDSQKMLEGLKRDINDFYDSCLMNVDRYLDWYYGSAGFLGLEKRYRLESADEIREQFLVMLKDGIDDESLVTNVNEYNEQKRSLQSAVEERLTNSNLSGIPEWAIANKKNISESPWFKTLDVASMLYEPEGNNTDRSNREEYRKAIKQAIQNNREETVSLIQ